MEDLTVKLQKVVKHWFGQCEFLKNIYIGAGIFLTGIILGILSNGAIIKPLQAPYNVYTVFFFLAILIFIHINFRNSYIGKWISGSEASLTSISLFASMILLMIFLPQNVNDSSKLVNLTGLSHVRSSIVFLLSLLFLLSSLGLVTLRRFYPLSVKNTGFFLIHFGLFITLITGLLGEGDIKRLTMNLLEKEDQTNIAITSSGEIEELPFFISLVDFRMEVQQGKFSSLLVLTKDSLKKDTIDIQSNKPVSFYGWKIYLQGYDRSKGKLSSLSILQIVRDPWFPLVYAGLFMLFAGTMLLFWKILSEKKTTL